MAFWNIIYIWIIINNQNIVWNSLLLLLNAILVDDGLLPACCVVKLLIGLCIITYYLLLIIWFLLLNYWLLGLLQRLHQLAVLRLVYVSLRYWTILLKLLLLLLNWLHLNILLFI